MNEAVSYNIAFLVLTAWSLFWTGIALWRAAKQTQMNWFVANLILGTNTAGLLPIIYLFWFSTKRLTLKEMKHWKFWKKSQ